MTTSFLYSTNCLTVHLFRSHTYGILKAHEIDNHFFLPLTVIFLKKVKFRFYYANGDKENLHGVHP